jgi:hypothetical protein
MTKDLVNIDKPSPIEKAVMVEIALLKALSIKEHFDNNIIYVDENKLLPETLLLLNCYKQYYKMYPEHKEIEFDTLLTQLTNNWHRDMHQEHINFYTRAIFKIRDSDLKDCESALLGLVDKQFLDNISKLGEKPFIPEQVHELVKEYENHRAGVLQECDSDCFALEDIDLSTANPEGGIPYAFNALQKTLYGQVQGDLIIVNAAYGIGKSIFIFCQIIHTFLWLHQQKDTRPILVFYSEGSPAQLLGRILSNLYKTKVPGGYNDILLQHDKILAHFFKKFNSKQLMIFRCNARGFQFVKDKVKKYKPAVVFIDMLKGLAAPAKRNESETSSLEALAQNLRDLSAVSCPIWATVQAGESAFYWDQTTQSKRHKEWIDSNDIYGSKTGIQGAASTIISIGMNDNRPNDRFIHTTKVKAEHNAKFICEIEKKYSNYKEVTWRDSNE